MSNNGLIIAHMHAAHTCTQVLYLFAQIWITEGRVKQISKLRNEIPKGSKSTARLTSPQSLTVLTGGSPLRM